MEKFEAAVEKAEKQLEHEAEEIEQTAGEHNADIFRAQIQFLNDPTIQQNIREKIGSGLSASKAVQEGFENPIDQLETKGGRTGERAEDLRDIRDRLLNILSGSAQHGLSNLPEETVIVAENLRPSDTSQLDKSKVKAIVTAKGSKTSHAAILSRSMGIPSIVGVGEEIEKISDSDRLLVDSDEEVVIVNPDEEAVSDIDTRSDVEAVTERVETIDGKEIEVASNVANSGEVRSGKETGSDGIGLYRTEFMFLDREEPPTEDEHYENYVEALETFGNDRVIVRTLDIGGDKPVPYMDLEQGENPFLGPRGVRLAFRQEGEKLFETQVRALLRAAATENGDNLSVMFPMIATLEEFEQAVDRFKEARSELESDGVDCEIPEIGLMIETPSAVRIAGELAEKADFLSIGTNDLTQYTMAASRTDGRVSDLQDPLYPSVLRSIKQVAEKAHANDTWVGMCGEMAGNPELTELLLGLGIDELSMSPSMVPRVKQNVREVSMKDAEKKAENVLEASKRTEVLDLMKLD